MAARNLPDERALATVASVGDVGAEPGSEAWAIAVRLRLQAHLQDALGDTARVQRDLRLMERHEGYKSLCDRTGKPFRSFRAFCLAKRPYGLEYDHEAVRLIQAEKIGVEERAEAPGKILDDGPPTLEERANRDYITDNKRGTDAEYLTARIARDHPVILERMKAGEYTSVRRAAIDAGIVAPRISIPTDPTKAARALRRHFTAAQIAALIDALRTPEDEQ